MTDQYLLPRPREGLDCSSGQWKDCSELCVVRCSELAVNGKCWLVAPENTCFLKETRLRAGEMRQTEFEVGLVHIVSLRPARIT